MSPHPPAALDPVPLDPVTVEVVRNKLDSIANEMQSSLLRSSFSPIVKEGLDASASLSCPTHAIAQSTSIAIHLGTLIPRSRSHRDLSAPDHEAGRRLHPQRSVSRRHAPARLAICMPAFDQGRVLGLSATMTHHQDVGGMMAGSVPTNATEIFQEGIRIPR